MKQMKTFVDQMVIKQPRAPWFGEGAYAVTLASAWSPETFHFEGVGHTQKGLEFCLVVPQAKSHNDGTVVRRQQQTAHPPFFPTSSSV